MKNWRTWPTVSTKQALYELTETVVAIIGLVQVFSRSSEYVLWLIT